MRRRIAGALPAVALVSGLLLLGPGPAHATTTIAVTRLAGVNRDETAIAASQELYPHGGAGAVVLASDANFPDALAGGPLAAKNNAPLLLTPPTGLTSEVTSEISRVVPAHATVYILGGDSAIAPSADTTLESMGFTTVRLAGSDRFGTAVAIANALGNPTTLLEASGLNFPDGLSAGAAAGGLSAAVLLTNGTTQAPETAAYLAAHPGKDDAIGGPAAAADPTATPIVGSDRYATAAMVATTFASTFVNHGTTLTLAGFASGVAFPDALSGGADIGIQDGPLLLVPSCGPLPSSLTAYLGAHPSITSGLLYGGTAAVGDDVATEISGSPAASTCPGSGPNPMGTDISSANTIVGISCPSTTWCMAVDGKGDAISYANGTWSSPTLVDNGANSGQSVGEFDGVSCPTTTWCMAVSYNDGYVIYQDNAWGPMTETPPTVAGSYHGVSCSSPSFCGAESDNSGDLTFYNGSSWAQPKAHNGIGIGDDVPTPISCVGTFCMYVTGDKYQTADDMVLSAAQTIDPATSSSFSPNVSCTTATSCEVVFAVGGEAEAWNGTNFTSAGNILASGDDSLGLDAVSCAGAFCGAASDKDLYTSSGTTWTHVGRIISSGLAVSMSCASNTFCMIGGESGFAYQVNPTLPLS